MQLLSRITVILCLAISFFTTGCGGGNDSRLNGLPPTLSSVVMQSPSYTCNVAVVDQGGGKASSFNYSCQATIKAPSGGAFSMNHTCRAGFQHTVNSDKQP